MKVTSICHFQTAASVLTHSAKMEMKPVQMYKIQVSRLYRKSSQEVNPEHGIRKRTQKEDPAMRDPPETNRYGKWKSCVKSTA